jgi:hypothetical protein
MAGCPPEVTQLLILVVGTLIGLAAGAVGFYLKDLRKTLREEQKTQSEDIEALRREATRLEVGLPEKFVLRDDFIRHVAKVDSSLQNIAQELALVSKNVAAWAKRSEG